MIRRVCLFLFFLVFFPSTAFADDAEDSYKKGRSFFLKKEWKEASSFFSQALQNLKLPASPTKKQKGLFQIGKADIFYHLAMADKEQNLLFPACKRFSEIEQIVKALPPEWRAWSVPPRLSSQFSEAATLLQDPCGTLRSPVAFLSLPPGATLQARRVPSSGAALASWETILEKASLLPGKYEILVKAEGYKDLVQVVSVPPWEASNVPLALALLPKDRLPPPLRRPDPPPPRTISPWVWVGVALGVLALAGGITAAVVIAEQNKGIFQPVLRLP